MHLPSSGMDVTGRKRPVADGWSGDNAAAEGFSSVLKREQVNRRGYMTLAEARSDLDSTAREYG